MCNILIYFSNIQMKHLQHICLKQMKYLGHTLENTIANILIYFSNIQMKHLQHICLKIYETFGTYT
jgi:hypothetical protein